MQEDNVLRKGIRLDDDYLHFVVKSSLILVSCNYARVKCSFITHELVDDICSTFKNSSFYSNGPTSFEDTKIMIFACADILKKYLGKIGFALFACNLFVKRLAPFFKEGYLAYLNAPLNKDELKIIDSKKVGVKRISDLNEQNYIDVMSLANQYASDNKKNLYFWELGEYNK